MQKYVERDRSLFVYIQGDNEKWIKSRMKKLGYSAKRGKSKFIDDLLTEQREKTER